MKKLKKLVGILLVIGILFGAMSVSATTAQAKSYWVVGTYSDSPSLTWTGEKFVFEGKWYKGSTENKALKKFYNGESVNFNKSFKKGNGLKTGTLSEEMVWDDTPSFEKNTNLVGITVEVKIKNNKVVRIIRSAR